MQTKTKDSINVLVAAKINKPLAYKIGSFDAASKPGTIVRVPLGGRTITGIVSGADKPVNPTSAKSSFKLKTISAVLSDEFSISPDLLSLLSWCQRYYHAPIGQVITAALPKSILNGKPVEPKEQLIWGTKLNGTEIEAISAPKQKEALNWIKQNNACSTQEILAAGFGRHLITALQKNSYIEIVPVLPIQTNQKKLLSEQPRKLNSAQKKSVEKINSTSDSFLYLLDGVTGSGKTEIYLQVAEKHIEAKRQVLILVPEIGLVDQTMSRFLNRFNCDVLAYHSESAESEKIRCWKSCRDEKPLIVIGTRSSIFLPFSNLGLIVVDEEQDLSYKQHEGFRYNARDVAVMRATSNTSPQKVTLILGSATPSLESLNNVNRGLFSLLQLKERIGERSLPSWRLVKPSSRESQKPLSDNTLNAINNRIEAGQQVLVFLNRRGFAPVLQCVHCGWQAKCDACDTAMTLHRQPSNLICHRCDNRHQVPQKCPDCQSMNLRPLGMGTEQIESFLQKTFPFTNCFRIDRDSTQRKGSFKEKLGQLEDDKSAILVGTQMITKGHHLPGISLVVVLGADSALLSHDFRALEHMAQSLTQVAGRAGRGNTTGEILIETSQPDHPVFRFMATGSYQEFSKQLIDARSTQCLPPFQYSALLHANSFDLGLLQQFMESCRQTLIDHKNNCQVHAEIEFIGPMPSPTEKRNNRFRYQIQMYSSSRSKLHTAVSTVEQMVNHMKGIGKIRFGIDIDPLTMD